MPQNNDFDIPKTKEYVAALLYQNFDEDLQIFWGPGPTMTNYPAYTPPSNWRGAEQINIPRVARFLYAVQTSYDTNAYNDATTPPVPPVPPASCPGYRYEIQAIAYSTTVRNYPDPDHWYLVEISPGNYGFNDLMNFSGTQAYLDSINIKITVSAFGPTVYLGTLWGAAGGPFIKKIPSRFVAWWRVCFDHLGTRSEVFIQNNLYTLGEGQDPNQPPRCWFIGTSGVYVSEVPTEAQNWYGCGAAPGSPPVAPPSPPI